MSGLLNVIGDIGSVWNAYDAAERSRADRAYIEAQRAQEQERQKIAAEMDRGKMEEYRRQQALQAQIRQTIASGAMSPNQTAIPATPALTVSDLDTAPDTVYDPGKPGLPAVKGQMNRGEGFRKAATVAQQAGEWRMADDLDQRAKAYKQEGLAELAQDLMGGADYRQAIRSYNARGDHRIDESTAQFDPNTKRLVYQSPNGPGMFDPKGFLGKNPKLINVPENGMVIDETGKVIANNKRDREAEEESKLKRAKELEKYKADLKAKADKGDAKATAEIKNIDDIAQTLFGGDRAKAYEYKAAIQGKSRTQVVRDMLSVVSQDQDFVNKASDEKLAAAERMADVLISRETSTKAGVRGKASIPAPTAPAQETKTIGGKRYEKVDGQWYEAN